MSLTPKQRSFVDEYLVDLNATQAAVRAGYSVKTARSVGAENLAKPDIKAAVEAALAKRSARVEVKADDVLRELLRIAMIDIGEAYDSNGKLKPIQDIPPDVRRAIASIDVFEEFEGSGKDRVFIGEVRKVKFWDKPRVLEMLGKHLGLLVERVKAEVETKVTDLRVDPKKLTKEQLEAIIVLQEAQGP